MIMIQEIDSKKLESKIYKVSTSFSTIEVDPKSNKLLFLKENKTVEMIEMKKSCRYIISEN